MSNNNSVSKFSNSKSLFEHVVRLTQLNSDLAFYTETFLPMIQVCLNNIFFHFAYLIYF